MMRAAVRTALAACVAVALCSSCALVDAVAPPDPSLARLTDSDGRGHLRTERCDLPAPGDDWTRATPESVGVDGDAVRDVLARLAPQFTASLRIYRRGCLIGETANDAHAATEPAELFSMTKSVVALLVGRAVELGALAVDDPIGEHLPGLDADHAAITVRHLLTQTSGLRFAWLNDLAGSTEDSVGQAMAMPAARPPGESFVYAQTTVTVLGAIVEAAVGADLQAFAQAELFGPIGIEPGSWSWWRDDAGHTHGYAWLRLRPPDMARLAHLVDADGVWAGRRLIGAGYLEEMTTGSAANPGYGFLTQNNATPWYVEGFGGAHRDHHLIPSAPADLVQFSGFLEQATFVVPSLELVVVRFGLPPGENWKFHLFERLVGGIPGARAVQPGPAPEPDPIGFDWEEIFAWTELFERVDRLRRCPVACGDRWVSPPGLADADADA